MKLEQRAKGRPPQGFSLRLILVVRFPRFLA
jgi:hypothetical protein